MMAAFERISGVLFRSVFLTAGAIAFAADSSGAAVASPRPQTEACIVDGATGVPIPQGARGACLATPPGPTLFVQRSEEGLLIAPLAETRGVAETAVDGTRTFSFREPISRVIFCPSSLLDLTTGMPTPACLAAASPPEPGPAALVGSGKLRADLRVDAEGRVLCPTVARVDAGVTSASGAQLELTSSIAWLAQPAQPDACTDSYDRIEITFAGDGAPASGVVHVRDSATDGAQRIATLLELDDEEWRTVELLLALTPRDWQAVEAVVERGAGGGGTAVPSDARGSTAEIQPIPVDHSVEPLGLPDTVDTILARVNAIRATVNALSGRTPDRPDVRSLVGQVDLGDLRDTLAQVRDTLRGLLDIASELRVGYDTFDATQFRQRLGVVLTDFESASTLYQRLLCADDPDIPIREISTTPLRRLIDRAPGVVLYGLSKILEATDPSWDQRIRAAIDIVPPEVTGLCIEGLRPSGARQVDAANVVCESIRPKRVGTGLALAKTDVAIGLLAFRYAKNHTKEEIPATLGADAVAGGTAGTSVKNPLYETISQWIDRLENLKDSLSDLTDRRNDCLSADKDVENDLTDCAKDGCICSVPLSVLLHGEVPPTYAYVADLVSARIDQAEAAGLPGTDDARAKHDEAIDADHSETPGGYGLLCQAYALLLQSTAPPPVVRVPRVRHSTTPGPRR